MKLEKNLSTNGIPFQMHKLAMSSLNDWCFQSSILIVMFDKLISTICRFGKLENCMCCQHVNHLD